MARRGIHWRSPQQTLTDHQRRWVLAAFDDFAAGWLNPDQINSYRTEFLSLLTSLYRERIRGGD